ncbi:MAG TPA: SUMF1/EgtB/PvdO family nonheme iron enzyme [Pyrinomonadaceae bacterium]|nr:SUMF1/EgtB/PvdO family nonheme iron enzyme [Pyrinomonadaceae bacterium]
METSVFSQEIIELCRISSKKLTLAREFCELSYEDVVDDKIVLKNVKIVGPSDKVHDLLNLCDTFKQKHKSNEKLQFVGPEDAEALFAELPEDTRADVRFDFLSYFKFFRSVIGVDFKTYLQKQVSAWNDHQRQFPRHIPVKLYRRGTPHQRLSGDDYVQDYLRSDQETNLEICYGEYGVGKTTFVLELESVLASRYLRDPCSNRIPVRVPLIEYRRANQIEDLIKRTITEPKDAFATDEVLWRLVEAGRFIFLLDGVDEMFELGTSEELQRRQLRELLRLQFRSGEVEEGAILQKARTLWTCRTTFFDSYEEIGKNKEIGEVLERIPHKKDLFVSIFDPASVQEQIEQASPELWSLVQRVFGLKTLARTALWFQMVLKRLSERVEEHGKVFSTRLIDDLIETAIDRERSEKQRSFERNQHEAAIEWLACTLHSLRHSPEHQKKTRVGFTARDIAELLFQYFQDSRNMSSEFDDLLKFKLDMERLFQAVRFCSFLSRYDTDDEGYYFYPEPFESYFVAMRLAKKDFRDQKLSIKNLHFTVPNKFPVSEGVCRFLFDEFSYQDYADIMPDRLKVNTENGWTTFPTGLFVCWDPEERCDFVRRIESFAIRQQPVTVAEYREFLKANPDITPPQFWDEVDYRRICPTEDCPVVMVSFEDAEKYCRWLTQKDGYEIRLPSYEQWQRAARGMDGRTFHWGMLLPEEPGSLCNGLEHWQMVATNARTTPVGSFDEKPFGLSDLIGNVWEYTNEMTGERVLARGASFLATKEAWKLCGINPEGELKVDKGRKSWDIGFRPVKVIRL